MRVVNPERTSRELAYRRKRALRRRRLAWGAFVVFGCAVVGAWIWALQKPTNTDASNLQPAEQTKQQESVQTEQQKPVQTLKTFSGDEFKALYSSFSYPFTEQIESPPPISGDPAADQHIQALAVSRGYALRSSPIADQLADVSDGFRVQKLVADPLTKLLSSMNDQSLPLRVSSAYRSVEDQRTLFIDRLADRGVSIESTSYIAEGLADDIIVNLLETTAPPGYSRHHTGYTLDFQCGSQGLASFEASPCFVAMSADNYKLVKQLGFIPSYPSGTSLQGPEPEPWEYIWVGAEALYQ